MVAVVGLKHDSIDLKNRKTAAVGLTFDLEDKIVVDLKFDLEDKTLVGLKFDLEDRMIAG